MTWEAGWRCGIISTVPYEQQKIYRQIILFQRIYYLSISLTGLPCHREPPIVLMSMNIYYNNIIYMTILKAKGLLISITHMMYIKNLLW